MARTDPIFVYGDG